MRHILSKFLLATAGSVILFSGTALAVDNMGDDNRGGLAKQNLAARLEGVKLKSCQNREKAINNILDRIASRGERRLGVYDKISERVQEFYTAKNLSVDNYDELVAAVNAKKDAATAAIAQTKNNDVEFNCDGTDPKSTAAGVKTDLKAEIKALHAYQQSIKDLIVAVKTSIGGSGTSGDSD